MPPVEWERLARTYIHLSREPRTTLGIVGYHDIRLAEAELIVRVRQEPADEAIENFYRLG